MSEQKNPIGIMQGRLSPPMGGRIQSFPVDTWREEFPRAREAGLACIEWVYEVDHEEANPLASEVGVVAIREAAQRSGVAVWSVCADYYMKEPLVEADGAPRPYAADHLRGLLRRAALLGVRYLVLPCVDESSLRSVAALQGLQAVLATVLPQARQAGVELHLETDLKPEVLARFLREVSHPQLRANYDIGNSASLGYDPDEELALLAPWLGSVHVKDRVLGGGTVPLGTGAANFAVCFRRFRQHHYAGPFILQAARVIGPSETALAIRNRQFVLDQIAAAESG